MKTKRILAVALAIVMIACACAVLASCGTAKVKWENYLTDSVEFAAKVNGSLPKAPSRADIPQNASVSTWYARYGLIVITVGSRTYGYSYATDSVIGYNDNLENIQPDLYVNGAAITYKGTYISGTERLYDAYGKELNFGDSITTKIITSISNGKLENYVQADVVRNDLELTYYYKMDGTSLESGVTTLPDANTKLNKGDKISKSTTTLGSWLKLDVYSMSDAKVEDIYLQEITVIDMGRNVLFYKGDKLLSTFTAPLYLDAFTYVDGKLLYTTKVPVDGEATCGYNLISGSKKFDVQTFSFDINSGRTKKLSVDYVLTGDETLALYNHSAKKLDLTVVSALRLVKGVAHDDNNSQDMLVINKNGAIAYSEMDNPYGMPVCKIGKNFLTVSSSMNIVNGSGKLVASFGNAKLESIRGESLIVSKDNKIYEVDFDGVITKVIDYEIAGRVYGDYVHVVNDFGVYGVDGILNLRTGSKSSLYEICNLPMTATLEVVDGMFIRREKVLDDYRYNYSYSWYLLDGTEVATETENSHLNLYTTTFGKTTYGFAEITSINGSTYYLRFSY